MALRVDLHFEEEVSLGTTLEPHGVRFTDAVGELFELVVTGFSARPDVDPAGLLGRRVTVQLREEPFVPAVRGIVRKARRRTVEATGMTEVDLSIVPPEWLLSLARRKRIFQRRSVPQIVAEVRSMHGAMSKAVVERLGSCPEREYCVQYDETDLEFVLRLLAEEGIASFHDHQDGSWTIADDTATGAQDVGAEVTFNPSNLTPAGPAVLGYREAAAVRTSKVVRRDFDFRKPVYILQGERAAHPAQHEDVEAALEDYAYETGVFSADGEGAALAQRRLEAHRATARKLVLVTNFIAGAGSRIRVAGPDIQGSWLVVAADCRESSGAGGLSALHELTVIPLEVPFRPRARPKPRVHGVETAFVVGDTPPGTVDTDSYGRVKIELRWDRRDLGRGNPTRWVRVAQAWAGAGYGFVTLPRVGDEVLVAYSQGDPDQPVVMGRVHNAVSVTPLSLPDPDGTKAVWRSQSFGPGGPVEGFNLIMMDDRAGAEKLAIRAQLDGDTWTGRNQSRFVGVTDAVRVGGSQSVSIGGSQTVTAGKDVSLTAGVRVAIEGGHNIDEKTRWMDVQASSKYRVGSPIIEINGGESVDMGAETIKIGGRSFIDLESPVLMMNGEVVAITAGTVAILGKTKVSILGGDVDIKGGTIKLNCS